MRIKIKRFDTSLPLPQYKTRGAACMDLCARLETVVPPRGIAYIPLNVAIEVPDGYWIKFVARSSTHKAGLIQANGMAVMDQDFCGDQDEYQFIAYNFTEKPVTVERGQRIAQLTLMKRETMELEEVEKLTSLNRGGIGSTGIHA